MKSKAEILEWIDQGENSHIEFKSDRASNDKLAIEIVAFSNFKGGVVLLGVNDSGEIEGLTRTDNEERLMNLMADLISPPIYPAYYEMDIEGKRIGVLEIEMGNNKPYFIQKKSNGSMMYYTRHGSTSRKITKRDELQRLFQSSKHLHYEVTPVAYSHYSDIHQGSLEDYLMRYRHMEWSNKPLEEKKRLLSNLDILSSDLETPTIGGLLLFGKTISKYLPQCGIQLIHIAGQQKTDEKQDHKILESHLLENIDKTMDWLDVRIPKRMEFSKKAPQRTDHSPYPLDALREIVVNAFVHRDYTIAGRKIMLWFFEDRIEIHSPGALPNTMSTESMKLGMTYQRNPNLVKFLYDAHYVEQLGQGIPKAMRLLEANGNPELEINELEEETQFIIHESLE